jgi:hypothetical protein
MLQHAQWFSVKFDAENSVWAWALEVCSAVCMQGQRVRRHGLVALVSVIFPWPALAGWVFHVNPENSSKQSYPPLPILHSFVVGFLLDGIILKKSAYPGTVIDKEAFTLVLLECIVIFLERDHSFALESKILAKTDIVFHRRRDRLDVTTIARIRRSILSRALRLALLFLCSIHRGTVVG